MNNTSFFSKIISNLKSKRETQIWREQDTIEISYPAISKEDLKDHWFLIPMLLLFCGFMIFGGATTLPGMISTINGLPPKTPPEEKYLLLIPIVMQSMFAIGFSVFLYRKVIRAIFLTEKLTLNPSHFIYSHGVWGNFKEVLRVNKNDLVSFAIRGNNVFRYISKASDGKNHLFVQYDKRKKKEIMGGRTDDEYMEIINVLEPYRTSADMYNMAIAIEERPISEQKESGRSKPPKKQWFINSIKTVLGPEPLEEKDCLKTNGIVGLMMLASIVFSFMSSKPDFSFFSDFLIVRITSGTVLVGGYLLAHFKKSLTRKILVLQGIVICLLVFIYTFFMWHVSQLISSGKTKSGMGHAPGLLAYGLAYGVKQVIHFSGFSSGLLVRKLPLIFFTLGACCDILVICFVFQCLRSWNI